MKVIIDRFENNKAVIKFKDGESFLFPIKYLKEGVTEGDTLDLSFSKDKLETSKQENLAKDILNEILSE